MNRSDRIYLSKFALDPAPDYLDLDDYDLCRDTEIEADELRLKKNFQKSSDHGTLKIQDETSWE